MPPNVLAYAVPGFLALLLVELALDTREKRGLYERRDTLASLALGLGNFVSGFGTKLVVFAALALVYEFRLFTVLMDRWWHWALLFVAEDVSYYGFHRGSHGSRYLWASHVVHHSSERYNLSTALRQTWTGNLSGAFVFWLWLPLVGFPPLAVLLLSTLSLIYQFGLHTEAVGRGPRWAEFVFNTPSHHRVHHAVNPRYLDRNYAGTFIVWDRMFGTFAPEVDDEPIRYGIVKQLGSFNLLWNVFHEWVGIARDVWRAPWRHKFSYLWREPGWSHDGSRETSDMIRTRWADRQNG